MKKSSKIFAGILIGGVLATSGVLVGCGGPKNNEPLAKTTDVYGFASATTGMLMSNENIAGQMLASASISSLDASNGLEDLKTKIDEAISQTLDKYMGVFDSVVGGKKPVDVSDEISDKEGFAHKLTISATTINGESNRCVLYFNETLKDDESVEVEDSDDEERETKLVGEMYLNGSEIPLFVEGSKEIDPEDNEVEVSFVAKFDKNDDNNKVVFKQEREEKDGKIEEEYVFEIVVGGVSTEFSFEMERDAKGNIEVEYEHNIAGSTISFEIEKSSNMIVIETKDFFGMELEINVAIEKVGEQERYVYTIPQLENLKIEGALK